MWEVVACPVADVDSFLSNPLRCVFGGDDGSVMDFFSSLDGSQIATVMVNAILPIAGEAIWAISPLGWLENVRS